MSTAEWAVVAVTYAFTAATYVFFLAVHHEGSKQARARLLLLAPVWPLVALRALHHTIHRLWRDALSADDKEIT